MVRVTIYFSFMVRVTNLFIFLWLGLRTVGLMVRVTNLFCCG